MPRPPAGDPGPLPRADGFARLLASSWRVTRAALGRLFWPYAAFALILSPFPFPLPGGALQLLLGALFAGSDVGTWVIVLYVASLSIPVGLFGSFLAALAIVVMTDDVCGRRSTAFDGAAAAWAAKRDVAAAGLLVALVAWGLRLLPIDVVVIGVAITLVLLGPPVLVHAVVLERVRFEPAVGRARALLRGAALRSFVYLLAAGLLVVLVLPLVVVVAHTAGAVVAGEAGATVAYFVALAAAGGVAFPFAAAAGLVVYFELRAVKEDLDAPSLCAQRAGP